MFTPTIVTLVDFSGLTHTLMDYSERYAKALRARVILIHIQPKEANLRGAAANLEDYKTLTVLGASLTRNGVNVLVEQLKDADLRRALDECRTWDAELIIVGSHHHSFLYNWFIGSFTCEVLKGAHCPVLVLPAIDE